MQLTWNVSIFGQPPVVMTYFNSTNDRDVLSNFVTTFPTGFKSDEFIQSTLELDLQPSIQPDQVMVECSMGDLERNITILHFIRSGNHYFKLLNKTLFY